MEPFYTGSNHDPGLAVELCRDIGWPVDPEYCIHLPVRIMNTGVEYAILQRAYDAAVSSDIKQGQVRIFVEYPMVDLDKSVSVMAALIVFIQIIWTIKQH